MSYGKPEQPDSPRSVRWGNQFKNNYHKQRHYRWFKVAKKFQLRRERRRAKADPECVPEYGMYCGYE